MFFQWQSPHRWIRVTNTGLALTLGLALASAARAQTPEGKTLELKTIEPDAKRDDPKARALFDDVSKAYKALTSYSDKGEFVVAMQIGAKKEHQVVPLKLTIARPNKLDLDAGQVRFTSDSATETDD
jgi:hypothetical protein